MAEARTSVERWWRRRYGDRWQAEMEKYAEEQAKAKRKVESDRQRAELTASFQEAMGHYRPGGGFGRGVEAGLERGRTRAVAGGMQSLVSSGLAGTTMAAGLGKKYEEEVAAPTRAGVESERAQRLSSLNVALGQAQQGAYQFGTAQDLQRYITNLQARTQARGQTGQLGLGYAQLEARQPQATISGGTTSQMQVAAPAAAPTPQMPPTAELGADAGRRTLPEGGVIRGDYYYPPQRQTYNAPQEF